MDDRRFDELTRQVGELVDRRSTIKGVVGGALAALLGSVGLAEAGHRDRRRRRRRDRGGREGDRCGGNDGDCRRGLRCCSRRCRDIRNDPDNCGDCAVRCRGSDRVCRNGGCFITCSGTAGICNTSACGTDCGCGALNQSPSVSVCKDSTERCTSLRTCTRDSDCPFGRACVDENCCANPRERRLCLRPCGFRPASVSNAPEAAAEADGQRAP